VVARLLTGILASVFLPLGMIFSLIGLLADDVDRGSPEGFLYAGLPLLAVGAGFAVAFAVSARRAKQKRARRTARTTAEVVEARMSTGVRSSGKFALKLTVRFEPAGTATTSLMWDPMQPLRPGDRIEVLYDPAAPGSFEPAGGAGIMGG
jgi:hypothetical protein